MNTIYGKKGEAYEVYKNSDLNVSRICMGCMGFGNAANGQHSWTLDEEHSREIIKRGLELGVNFFDTAIGYQSGTSEQYVDLYIYHMWDYQTPLYDIMERLNNIVRAERRDISAFPTALPSSLRKRMHWRKKKALQDLSPFRGITI